jgi:hypothetical protein
MTITKHGKKRMKERLGLHKRAQNRHLEAVIRQGILYSREGWSKFKVVYHGFLYVFALDAGLKPVLVTTIPIDH